MKNIIKYLGVGGILFFIISPCVAQKDDGNTSHPDRIISRMSDSSNLESIIVQIRAYTIRYDPKDWDTDEGTAHLDGRKGGGILIDGKFVLTALHVLFGMDHADVVMNDVITNEKQIYPIEYITDFDAASDLVVGHVGMPRRNFSKNANLTYRSQVPMTGENVSTFDCRTFPFQRTQGKVIDIQFLPQFGPIIHIIPSVHRGNSGVPLLDEKNELVGIAILGDDSITVFVPAKQIKKFTHRRRLSFYDLKTVQPPRANIDTFTFGECDNVLSILEQQIKRTPLDFGSYLRAGICCIQIDRETDAIKYISDYIQFNKNNTDVAYYYLGVAYNNISKYTRAIELLKKVTANSSKYKDALEILDGIYSRHVRDHKNAD